MNKFVLALLALSFLGGCAATEEAYYVDREFGKAQMDAFDQQIAYKDYRYAGETPTGMSGIHSEKIMDTYQKAFSADTGDAPDNNFSKGFVDLNSDNTSNSNSVDSNN